MPSFNIYLSNRSEVLVSELAHVVSSPPLPPLQKEIIVVQSKGMERWLIGHTLELTTAGVDLHKLRADTQRLGPGMEKASRTMFDMWLDHVGVLPARVTAPAT